MDPDPRIERIFGQAVEKPTPAEQVAFADEACAGDAELRSAVQALLEAHHRPGAFLELPEESAAEGPGTKIGRYKLVQKIGEGGFGVVYLAEQEHPVRRQVALKIIKLGMDTRQVIARFEAERQALALMDHPSIARVFDAGATDTGRPYFVMELVRGVPITDYCDANQLTVRDRLDLFFHVCNAVQHAHQKGIIHRDLKPTNVLVAMSDGRPVPKVIDFGVAKATQQRLTEHTFFTEFRQLIGTPEYMSPEQAEMAGIDIDTRSDIFSLGVLLYELLVGCTPFDPKELRSKAYGEMQRIIREVEPPLPSTRLSSLAADSLPGIAARRRAEPRRLIGAIRGDLDWVVMRAMEKDRTRRYGTASELADDIRRYLEDRPVSAGPPGRLHALRKFVRRNRVALVAGTIVSVSLVGGTVAASFGLVRARHERKAALDSEAKALIDQKRAQNSEGLARREAARAAAINKFLIDMLNSASPKKMGKDVTVRQVLDAAAAQLEKRALKDHSDTVVILRRTLGNAYSALAVPTEAEKQYKAGLELQRTRGEENSIAVELMTSLANTRAAFGDTGEAERLLKRAMEITKKLNGEHSIEYAKKLDSFSLLLQHEGRPDLGQPFARRAVEIISKLPGNHDADLAQAYKRLGWAYGRNGNLVEADEARRREYEIRLRRGEKVDAPQSLVHPSTNPADTNREIEKLRRQIEEERKKLDKNDSQLAGDLGALGYLLREQHRLVEAEPLLREALEITVRNTGDLALFDDERVYAYSSLLRELGDVEGARRVVREHLTRRMEQLNSLIASKPADAEDLPRLLDDRATTYVRQGKIDLAVADFRRAIALSPDDFSPRYGLGLVLLYTGDVRGYRAVADEMFRRFADATDPGVAWAAVDIQLRQPCELDRTRPVVRALEQKIGETNGYGWKLTGAEIEFRTGRLEQALASFRSIRGRVASNPLMRARLDADLAMIQHQLGHVDEARAALAAATPELARYGSDFIDIGWDYENWFRYQIAVREAYAQLGVPFPAAPAATQSATRPSTAPAIRSPETQPAS